MRTEPERGMFVNMSLNWRDVERMAAIHLALIHVGLGVSIVVGGPERFPPPTYNALLEVFDGQVWPFGLVFILIGLMLVYPYPRLMFFSHCLGVLAFNIFAGLFFVSMVKNPEAAATAWWAYFSLGTIHGFNIALMTVRRKQHLYPELERHGGGET